MSMIAVFHCLKVFSMKEIAFPPEEGLCMPHKAKFCPSIYFYLSRSTHRVNTELISHAGSRWTWGTYMIPTMANNSASQMSFVLLTWRLRLLSKGDSLSASVVSFSKLAAILERDLKPLVSYIGTKHFAKVLPKQPTSRFHATGKYWSKVSGAQCSELISCSH